MDNICIDIISLLIAVISFGFSIFCWAKNRQLEKINIAFVEKQTLIEQGALETQIRSAIYDATKELARISYDMIKNQNVEEYTSIFKTLDELYRNTYEDACAKYLDGKIDKERFKKMYQHEIRELVTGDSEKEHYASNQTKYVSTIAVYKEWFSQA